MNLRPATEHDLREISAWFLTECEAKSWGGPKIRFPFRLEQLKNDIEWDVADSFALVDKTGNLIGFAQIFDRFGCKHLGRIALSPKMRGRKLGYKLMAAILKATDTDGVGFSLFVYEDNIPARRLYERIGFKARAHPRGQPEIKGCLFMVKE